MVFICAFFIADVAQSYRDWCDDSSLDDLLLEPWVGGTRLCFSSTDGFCALLDPAALGLLGPFCCWLEWMWLWLWLRDTDDGGGTPPAFNSGMGPPTLSTGLPFELLVMADEIGGIERGPPAPSTPKGKAPYGPLANRPGRREPGGPEGGIRASSRSLSLNWSKLRPILGPAPKKPGNASQAEAEDIGVVNGEDVGYILNCKQSDRLVTILDYDYFLLR